MGKKTPEGIAKDKILEGNGGFAPAILALFVNFTGYVQYEDKDGNKRGYKAGLTTSGSSDIIAAYSLEITPEMVGKTVLAFGVLEVKREDQPPKPTPGQVAFINKVIARGGFGGVVRNIQEVKEVICRWLNRLKSQ